MFKLWVGFPVFYVRVAPHAMIVFIIKKAKLLKLGPENSPGAENSRQHQQ